MFKQLADSTSGDIGTGRRDSYWLQIQSLMLIDDCPPVSALGKTHHCHGECCRHAGDAFRDVLFEGVHLQDFGERVLQPNAIQHCLALVILLALLVVQLFGSQVLHLLGQMLAILGIEQSSNSKLTNLPSLAIALRSRLLIGPGSYSMENSDKYAEAFASQESLDQKDARSKRKSDKRRGKGKKSKVGPARWG